MCIELVVKIHAKKEACMSYTSSKVQGTAIDLIKDSWTAQITDISLHIACCSVILNGIAFDLSMVGYTTLALVLCSLCVVCSYSWRCAADLCLPLLRWLFQSTVSSTTLGRQVETFHENSERKQLHQC